jgi:hypothetical protein
MASRASSAGLPKAAMKLSPPNGAKGGARDTRDTDTMLYGSFLILARKANTK